MRKAMIGFYAAGLVIVGLSALLSAAATAPVADAAMNGDKAAVRSLLKSAADVNAAQGDGMTALHWAAINGDAELAQMLVLAGANVRATTRLRELNGLQWVDADDDADEEDDEEELLPELQEVEDILAARRRADEEAA